MRAAITDTVAMLGAALLVLSAFMVSVPLGVGLSGIVLLLAAASLARSEAQ